MGGNIGKNGSILARINKKSLILAMSLIISIKYHQKDGFIDKEPKRRGRQTKRQDNQGTSQNLRFKHAHRECRFLFKRQRPHG